MSSFPSKVLVTGGTGFIGLHIIQHLLDAGCYVNATSRSLNPKKTEALRFLQDKYPYRLFLFEAELLKKRSFKDAMFDVEAVFHVATPVLVGKELSDAYEQQVRPAVEGKFRVFSEISKRTQNVLDTCLETSSVKTIIITSSTMAVYSKLNLLPSHDESNFNTFDTLETNAYSVAKVKAKEVVWNFEKQHKDRFRIVFINPTLVLGPIVFPNTFKLDSEVSNSGLQIIKSFLNGGRSKIPQGGATFVDVRDVAKCHVLALKTSTAQGRFICSSSAFHWTDMISLIKKFKPSLSTPTELNPELDGSSEPPVLDTSKSISILGIKYRGLEESIKDALSQIEDI